MKKFAIAFACLFLCLGAALQPSLATQQTIEVPYVVQTGDTLWDLAGLKLDDPLQWKKVVDANPFLQQPGRIRDMGNGRILGLIKPNERLMGLQQFGILPTLVPISELKLPQPAPVIVDRMPVWAEWTLGGLLGLLLLALLAAVAVWLLLRNRNKPAVTSGTPFERNGVTGETAPVALERAAQRQFSGRRVRSISNITRHLGWGTVTVNYADGHTRVRNLNGDLLYRADVEFEDGSRETLMMLQGCGNDIRRGTHYILGQNFRLEDYREAQPAPAPEPVPQPAPVAEVPQEPAEEAEDPIPQGDGVISFEFKPAEGEQPTLIRATGVHAEKMFFSSGPNGVTVRIFPKKPVPANAPAPAGTAPADETRVAAE